MTIARLAAFTAACTYVLIVSGGVVHATGSSLACPDWPLCHGELMPAMVGGVEFEHTHRILGAVVGLATLALAGVAFRRRRDRALAAVALAVVAVQGTLGGLTVLYRLPTAISTAHLGTSLLFLALLVFLWSRDHVRLPCRRRAFVAAIAVAAAVWLQSVLGAIVRHTGAGLACGLDPVSCMGTFAPAWSAGQLHMAHRVGGVLVALIVVAGAWRVWRDAPGLRAAAGAAVGLVLVQIGLGALSVTSALGTISTAAHLAVAAALFAGAVVVAVRTAPVGKRPPAAGGSRSSLPSGCR